VHFKQADSWVSYTTELAADGYISFLVNASSHYDIGPSVASEFFIDNVPQPLHDLIAHTYSFPVSAGTHTFLWLHHQDQESLHGDIRTVVSQIRIMGASSGGYVAYDCPAGYASSGGRNPCTICPAGTYSPNTKSTQCWNARLEPSPIRLALPFACPVVQARVLTRSRAPHLASPRVYFQWT
jgi:hypothetical protein